MPCRGDSWSATVARQALWLRAECCGGRALWAFNQAHLTFLEDYVAAGLRERGRALNRMTLVARLPAWLKSAKNRDEVLRVIGRLRDSLGSPGRSTSSARRSGSGRRAGTVAGGVSPVRGMS